MRSLPTAWRRAWCGAGCMQAIVATQVGAGEYPMRTVGLMDLAVLFLELGRPARGMPRQALPAASITSMARTTRMTSMP